MKSYWDKVGLDQRYVAQVPDRPTGTSVALIDSDAQPRFIHTSGANATLTADGLDVPDMLAHGARSLHIGGYFVLPGLQGASLSKILEQAHSSGLLTTLDVVKTSRMDEPDSLWMCLPYIDVFLCNTREARYLTGENTVDRCALALRKMGARSVIIKLGVQGCWLEEVDFSGRIPAPKVKVVDTTGAGDAFAAGLIASLLRGEHIQAACQAGNLAGARTVGVLGALGAWF